jgi:hypothetical protein
VDVAAVVAKTKRNHEKIRYWKNCARGKKKHAPMKPKTNLPP